MKLFKQRTDPLPALEVRQRQLAKRHGELAQELQATEAEDAAAKKALTEALIHRGDVSASEARVRLAVDRRDGLDAALAELDRQREEVPAWLAAARPCRARARGRRAGDRRRPGTGSQGGACRH